MVTEGGDRERQRSPKAACGGRRRGEFRMIPRGPKKFEIIGLVWGGEGAI